MSAVWSSPRGGELNIFKFPDLNEKGVLNWSVFLKKTLPSHGKAKDKELKQFKEKLIVQCANIINKTVSE